MRKCVAILLLIVYVVLIIIPYLPYIYYNIGNKRLSEDHCIISTANDNNTLIGDLCYLKALIERAKTGDHAKKQNVPPETNVETSNLVYISTETLINTRKPRNTEFKFNTYTISIKETFQEVPNPPPKTYS